MSHVMDDTAIARYDVGNVRRIAVSVIEGAVNRARVLISCTAGCEVLVEKLRSEAGELVKARLAEMLMVELGHATLTSAEDPNSEIRRAVKRVSRG